ncbi:hypothetical protein [Cohaesibacter sp. CAU 1516]|uniref:hypothetical protein n=1 Tax=Cohaesibacter sp. CAU 1516 TaxID=2576038 RepID=UPI001FEF20E5|nr:hypothetical protein [Cohaesibacter sp. CAU 1516]
METGKRRTCLTIQNWPIGFLAISIRQNRKITDQNAKEAYEALQRDRAQRQQLIVDQLKERQIIDKQRKNMRQQAMGLVQDLRSDRDRLIEALENPTRKKARRRNTRSQQHADSHVYQDHQPEP